MLSVICNRSQPQLTYHLNHPYYVWLLIFLFKQNPSNLFLTFVL